MRLVVDEWFSLPRLGTDVFMKLVREARLQYEKGKGFRATASTDLVSAISMLEPVLGEKLEIEVRCFICGAPANCPRCAYSSVCDRRKVSPRCICETCKEGKETFALYSLRFAELIPQ